MNKFDQVPSSKQFQSVLIFVIVIVSIIALNLKSNAQDLQKAYEAYCTEGINMQVDSIRQTGIVEIEISFNESGEIIYGKRDTTWYEYNFEKTKQGYIINRYSCTHSSISGGQVSLISGGIMYLEEPKKREINKVYYSKPKTTIYLNISRMVYNDFYYKEPKKPFEDWLRNKKYIK